MQEKIDALAAYLSTNGSLSDAVAFTQLVASEAWGQIAKLYSVMQGVL